MISKNKIKNNLKILLGLPLTHLHPHWTALSSIGPLYRPHTILDVGSHHGWFFHCWKDWCPEARIHAFEPRVESARKSMELYGDDPELTVNMVAVGETPGQAEFHVLEDSRVSSSFLQHNQKTWDAVGYKTGEVTTRQVPVITIDGYCAQQSIDSVYLMKIDVQGYEMNVLRGTEKSLCFIDHIFVEAGIQPLYHDAPDFTDVYRFMKAHDFHLMGMRTWHRGNHVLMETDMLFRRNELAPPVDETIDRITENA